MACVKASLFFCVLFKAVGVNWHEGAKIPFCYFRAYTWLCFITISPVSLRPPLFPSQMLKRKLFLSVICRLVEQKKDIFPMPGNSKVKVKVAQSCQTLCDPMDYTVPGILQARILKWVTFPFSRGSSHPRDWTQVSLTAGRFFPSWATRQAVHEETLQWLIIADCITHSFLSWFIHLFSKCLVSAYYLNSEETTMSETKVPTLMELIFSRYLLS